MLQFSGSAFCFPSCNRIHKTGIIWKLLIDYCCSCAFWIIQQEVRSPFTNHAEQGVEFWAGSPLLISGKSRYFNDDGQSSVASFSACIRYPKFKSWMSLWNWNVRICISALVHSICIGKGPYLFKLKWPQVTRTGMVSSRDFGKPLKSTAHIVW